MCVEEKACQTESTSRQCGLAHSQVCLQSISSLPFLHLRPGWAPVGCGTVMSPNWSLLHSCPPGSSHSSCSMGQSDIFKTDHITPLVRVLQWLPVICRVKAKFLTRLSVSGHLSSSGIKLSSVHSVPAALLLLWSSNTPSLFLPQAFTLAAPSA